MSESHLPPHDQIRNYTDLLGRRLVNVPELRPALDLAISNPDLVVRTYEAYVALIDSMAAMTEEDKLLVDHANKRLASKNTDTGSASKVSAIDLLDSVGDAEVLSSIAKNSIDRASPFFDDAIDELIIRLEGGHQFKLAGKTPVDGDPESNKIIWGHTQITDPNALLNFTICHFLERYFAKELSARDIAIASQKDFFLNALIDVVIIDHLTLQKFKPIFELWAKPKNQGGMGWIIPDRLNSYTAE